jgi:hypothetical protein
MDQSSQFRCPFRRNELDVCIEVRDRFGNPRPALTNGKHAVQCPVLEFRHRKQSVESC